MTSSPPRQIFDGRALVRRASAVRRWLMRGMHSRGAATVLAIALGVMAAMIAAGTAWFDTLRERTFDTLLAANLPAPKIAADQPVVVDIDRATLERHGGWPWSRERLAELLTAIGAGKPRVVGLDILLDGADDSSPAALARKLARVTNDAGVARLAAALPDGDARLADVMGQVPTVLGALLDPSRETPDTPLRPIAVRNAFNPNALWQEAGLILPPDVLRDVASGIGAIALAGDGDAGVRRVPLIVVGGMQLVPGLAVELARIARSAPLISIDGKPRSLLIGAERIPLAADGMLRLVPGRPATWAARTIGASDILAREPAALERLKGRIVLLGSSAPELGGLRPSGSGDLAPSVQLQADAVSQLLDRVVPQRSAQLQKLELIVATLAIIAAGFFGAMLSPVRGALATAALAAVWIIAALVGLRWRHLLVDPLLLPASVATTFTATALLAAAHTLRRETAIRHRFEQHLAPAVVQQIIARPDALKLAGEIREITAFFTDVEGFTSMTDRAEPHQLIEVLDDYFDEMSRIVVAHGGLVDKIVGDAVHAIFNAPFDLPDHPRRALEAALAIEAFSHDFRRRELPMALGFGMTRIGFETGPAIVGDVGGSRKLDYTAHGNAMNAAARLEAANKELGTTIAIGPGAAGRLPVDLLRPLGLYAIRGRNEPQAVCSVWPPDIGPDDRDVLSRAAGLPRADALAALRSVAARRPDDVALARQIARLCGVPPGS